MARSARSREEVLVVRKEENYWPSTQLNIWNIIILATAGTILGVFAQFMDIQSKMRLGTPWLFPFGVTVGALTIFFVIVELVLIAQRRLLPGYMMLISFILLVLYITGVIETAIQLFGAPGVSTNCQCYVNNNPVTGVSVQTLAWLQQNNICSCWYAAFSFWIIGAVFFVWMMVLAMQVSKGEYDRR